jgi:NAD(P)-dependent dehydrogenase (short-subunit alcohol dehydrogenase family)
MALLKGKTAVITGGSAGVGLAIAKRFAEEGAHVFINGRTQAELDAAVREIGGDSVTGVQGDGSKPGDRDRLYAAVADAGWRLDVLFANAAAIDVARIGDITREHLRRAVPLLNDGGSIIVNSADGNAEGDDGGAYAAIVAALRSLAPTWAGELRERKIRVNVISPDATETPGINALAGIPNPGPNTAGESESYQHGLVPLARHATTEEVADAALFLASGLSS